MASGYLALVLHAHLPFVRHPEHEYFLEEDWLFEAISETYQEYAQACLENGADGVFFAVKAAAAGEMTRQGGRGRRVAGHKPVEAARLNGRQVQELTRFDVVHHRRSRSPIGTATRTPARSWPRVAARASRRRSRARRVRVLTVPSG